MRGHTHALAGAAIGSAVAAPLLPLIGRPAAFVLVGGAALASLLPDLDHPYSLAGRWVPRILAPAYSEGPYRQGRRWFWLVTIWHREQFHSLGAALILAGFSIALLLPLKLSFALLLSLVLFLGYCSHLLLDLVNVSPQMLLWPLSEKHFKLHWHGVRENSWLGSLTEWLVGIPALLLLTFCLNAAR